MIENSHMELSTFVKKTHEDLRQQSQLIGECKAWKLHCLDDDKLKKYASAMKELSLKYWEPNYNKTATKAVSRIKWTRDTSVEYFTTKIYDIRKKEYQVMKKHNLKIGKETLMMDKWKVLDVGSCYNPFKVFGCFDVIAIDIAPATTEVFKGDFLSIDIGPEELIESHGISKLRADSFDLVVFSLFLEYLPSPSQRLNCCKKAYNLLKSEGLLVIITPDSKHVGSNAKLMKSWRVILAEMGLCRIKYEKLPHIHCMAFRKTASIEVAINWAKLHQKDKVFDQIYIPQDFTHTKCTHSISEDICKDPTEKAKLFALLPDGD